MRKPSPIESRATLIAQVRRRLLRESHPRVQMALIVALTGGFGLLASFCMLRLGLESMAIRYPLALTFAYLCFLGLIWLWLRTKASDYDGSPDIPDLGGRCGGDGASGGGGESGGSGGWDGLPSAFDAMDDAALPLLAIALIVGMALAALMVIYQAPLLFAELLVDGALSLALYRRLRRQDARHWLGTTVRRTAIPFVATAVFLAGTGLALAHFAPGAHSVGQVLEQVSARSGSR